jgi:hypothetical protein
MPTILTNDEEDFIWQVRAPLRATLNQVGDEHTRRFLFALFGFRNATLGPRRAASRKITPDMRRQIRAYPHSVTDREIAQEMNVAIHHVSRIRRRTRK